MGINLGNLEPAPPIQQTAPVVDVTKQEGVQAVDKGNGQITLNLAKSVKLDLSKAAPSLTRAIVGLGWDPICAGKIDLDVFALLLHNGKILDTSDIIFFNQKDTGKSVTLNKDNRDGQGEGDDEQIRVDLSKVPADITSIAFFVNIYEAEKNSQNFGMVKNSYIRLVNEDTNKEEAIYILNEEGGLYTAFHFANLVRENGNWHFETVGKGMHGDVQVIANMFS